jgi:hypothetical protein
LASIISEAYRISNASQNITYEAKFANIIPTAACEPLDSSCTIVWHYTGVWRGARHDWRLASIISEAYRISNASQNIT